MKRYLIHWKLKNEFRIIYNGVDIFLLTVGYSNIIHFILEQIGKAWL